MKQRMEDSIWAKMGKPLLFASFALSLLPLSIEGRRSVFDDRPVAPAPTDAASVAAFSIICPEDKVLIVDDDCPIPIPDYRGSISVTGGVSLNSLVVRQTPAPGLFINGAGRIHEVTITAFDGETYDTCYFNILLEDRTDPILKCPQSISSFNDSTCRVQIPDIRNLVSVTNTCDFSLNNLVMIQSPAPGEALVTGDRVGILVSVWGIDRSGNTGRCNFFININDTVGPALNCPENILVLLDSTDEYVIPNFLTEANIRDNCVPLSSLINKQEPPGGTILKGDGARAVVTLESSDENGNGSACSFEIFLDDVEDPNVDCPDDPVFSLDDNCEVVVPDFRELLNLSDNVTPSDSILVMQEPPGGARISVDAQLISILVDDRNGNTVQCFLTVSFEDLEGPQLNCPDSIVVLTDRQCDFIVPDFRQQANLSDNCFSLDTIDLVQMPAAGEMLDGMAMESFDSLSFQATDPLGNATLCRVSVTVVDTLAPQLRCPSDTLILLPGCELAVPNFRSAFLDASLCVNRDAVFGQFPSPGTIIPTTDSTFVLRAEAVDSDQNRSTCSTNVTIRDGVNPQLINCPRDTLIPVRTDCSIRIPDFVARVAATDNCDPAPAISQDIPAGNFFVFGDSLFGVRIEVRDRSGNTSACVVRIRTRDFTPPSINCPDDLRIELDDAGRYVLPDFFEQSGVSDNCTDRDDLLLSQKPDPGIVITAATARRIIELKAADRFNNQSDCRFDLIYPHIGLAKRVEKITLYADGTYVVDFELKAVNLGTETLYDIQLSDDLSAFGMYDPAGAFAPAPGTYHIFRPPAVTENTAFPVLPEGAFNGADRKGLLQLGGRMEPGERFTLTFSVRLLPAEGVSRMENQAMISADLRGNGLVNGDVTDYSTDGGFPDPDSDGNATEAGENEPTPVILPQEGAEGMVEGGVSTSRSTAFQNVEMILGGDTSLTTFTDPEGRFRFAGLKNEGDFTLSAHYDKDHRNGVSTLDIYLTELHLLGIQPFTDPYQILAADVNNSRSVSFLDLVSMRRIVLSIDTSFPLQKSWRFFAAGHQFSNPANPFLDPPAELLFIPKLSGLYDQADFLAVKTGDVNHSARLGNAHAAEVRSGDQSLELAVRDQLLVAGQRYRIPVTAANLFEALACQFTLEVDREQAALQGVDPGLCTADELGVFPAVGSVSALWYRRNQPADNIPLFYLDILVKREAYLSEVLRLTDLITPAISYSDDYAPRKVELIFQANPAGDLSEVTLFQNRPNPVTGATSIPFFLPAPDHVTLTVRDHLGRVVWEKEAWYAAGRHEASLQPADLPGSGVYLYTLTTEGRRLTRKLLVTR